MNLLALGLKRNKLLLEFGDDLQENMVTPHFLNVTQEIPCR